MKKHKHTELQQWDVSGVNLNLNREANYFGLPAGINWHWDQQSGSPSNVQFQNL